MHSRFFCGGVGRSGSLNVLFVQQPEYKKYRLPEQYLRYGIGCALAHRFWRSI
jgi:hypothetical protein